MLANDDAAKIAACVISAEAWATNSDGLEDDLRREIEAMQVAFKAGEDATYREQAAAHRAKYGNPSTPKGFTERRAAQLAAAQPRPEDHLGGPVTWEGPA